MDFQFLVQHVKSFENPYGVNDVSFRFEATDNSVLRVLDQWAFSGQDSQKKTYTFRLIDGYWKYGNGEKINGGEMNEGTINKEVIKLYMEYLWLLDYIFGGHTFDIIGRKKDRALWVYGHASEDYNFEINNKKRSS